MDLNIDLSDAFDRKMLNKMKKGMPVQLKPSHLQGPGNVRVSVSGDKLKKAMKAMRSGKGVRMSLSPEESETIEGVDFTSGGRVKSLKQLNRESAQAFKKVGKTLEKTFTKDIPAGYKKDVRKYSSPFFKGMIEYALPTIASDLVGGIAKTLDLPPIVEKSLQAGVKSGVKPLATKAYKKSGLGVKSDVMGLVKKGKRGAKKGIDYLGSGLESDVMGLVKKGRKGAKKGIDYMGMGLESDVMGLVKKGRKGAKKGIDYLGSGLISSPELMAGLSNETNPLVDGGMYNRRIKKPEVLRLGAGSKQYAIYNAGAPGVRHVYREETSQIPLIGGRLFRGNMIDPTDSAYAPNPFVDAFHPEMNLKGKGLYAGRPGMGLY